LSDELQEEMANDPPDEHSSTETLSGETSDQSSEESPQRSQQMGSSVMFRNEQDSGRYYCQKCFERASSCECESPRLFVPPVWELDSKGRHLRRAAQATSVPAVGGLVVTGAQHDAKLEQYLKNWHPERHDDDTYVGFLRNTMSPSVATEKLKAGCSICGHSSSWRDTVYWYSDWGHVCIDCKDKTHDYIGPVSTYKSRYTEGADNAVVKH
jgi:hypothetical protein